ncbi:MAG: SynChlorMet cassette radical SAM/SPASM protein ScmF [Anaerolineales bacterium]
MKSPQHPSAPAPQHSVTPPLTQLYFYLTEGCNLACRHCWLAPKYDPKGSQYPTLDITLFETAIVEAKPLGLERVKLTGGEPLLHPRFLELLAIVRREELGLTLETNGMLCTPEVAAEIARIPQRFVSISIDGADAATHEWVRGVKGSFERAQQAVRNLVAVGIRPQIIMTLLRENFDQLAAIVRLAEELGAASVKFNVLQPTARGENIHTAGANLGVEEILEMNQFVQVELQPLTQIKLHYDVPMAFIPLSRLAEPDGAGRCSIRTILGVIHSGHYALCGIGEHLSEMVFGQVGADTLDQLWHGNEVLTMLRTGLPDKLEGICAKCLMRHTCLGQCIALNVYRTGSLWAPFWFCEQAEAAGRFPGSRLIPEMFRQVR